MDHPAVQALSAAFEDDDDEVRDWAVFDLGAQLYVDGLVVRDASLAGRTTTVATPPEKQRSPRLVAVTPGRSTSSSSNSPAPTWGTATSRQSASSARRRGHRRREQEGPRVRVRKACARRVRDDGRGRQHRRRLQHRGQLPEAAARGSAAFENCCRALGERGKRESSGTTSRRLLPATRVKVMRLCAEAASRARQQVRGHGERSGAGLQR